MIYIVAILLALILVAMISSNKDARFGVQSFLTILIALFLILAIWMTSTGWSLYFFFGNDDSEKTWYFKALSITFSILTPPILLWINKNYLLKLFKNEKKEFFKILSFVLIGIIGFNSLLLLFDIIKKEVPFFGWVILISILVISGFVILNRCIEKGWKTSLTFKLSPWDQVVKDYDDLQAQENKRWAKFAESWTGDKDDYEYQRLQDEHFERYDTLDSECNEALEKVRGVKKKEDWWLFAFYYSIAFICLGLIGYVWDYVLALVIEFEFIKERVWLASVIIVGTPLVLIGLIIGIYEDHFKKLN